LTSTATGPAAAAAAARVAAYPSTNRTRSYSAALSAWAVRVTEEEEGSERVGSAVERYTREESAWLVDALRGKVPPGALTLT
jgi:hypothetical protein